MKNTIKSLEEGKVEVTCDVDKDVWATAQDKAFHKLAQKVAIKGFRPGKVPEGMIKAQHLVSDSQIINEAIDEALTPVYAQMLSETHLEPFARPSVDISKLSKEEIEIKYTFVTFPKVTLGEHKGLKAKKVAPSVSEKEVSDAIASRLEKAAELVPVDRPAQKGDTVTLDFEGKIDGKAFEGGSAKDYELELGSNSFVPGFEDALIGVKPGEEKDVNITFPTQYVKELAGKPAVFACKIHEVKEKKIPALSDEAVKDFGIDGVETVEAMKDYQQKALLSQKNNRAEDDYYNAIVAQIVANSKVEIAHEIVEQEANTQLENTKKQIEQNGLTFEQYLEITGQTEEAMKKSTEESSKANLVQYLVLQELAHEEGLDVSDAELDTDLAKMADQYKMKVEDVKRALGNLDAYRDSLRSRKIHDWIMANSGVIAEAKAEEAKPEEKAPEAKPEAVEKKPAAKKAPAKKAAPKAKAEEKPAEGK